MINPFKKMTLRRRIGIVILVVNICLCVAVIAFALR